MCLILVLLSLALVSKCEEPEPIRASPAIVMNAVNKILENIKSSFPSCSLLDILYESNSHISYNWKASCEHNWLEDPTVLSSTCESMGHSIAANLQVDLTTKANIGDSPVEFFFENRYYFKYNQPCSLILLDLNAISFSLAELAGNSSDYGRRWPERILPLLPNTVQRSFFMIYTLVVDSSTEIAVNRLMRRIGMIQYSLFLLPSASAHDNIEIFKGLPQNPEIQLTLSATYMSPNDYLDGIKGQKMFEEYPDFEGATVISVYCLTTEPDDEFLEAHGVEKSSLETAWRLVHKNFNATPEIEILAIIPGTGFVDDEYDEYTLPLLEGTAAITGLLNPSSKMQRLIDFTPPYFFDAVGFLTGPVKIQRNSGSFGTLLEPLGSDVWAAFATLSFCTVLCVEFILAVAVSHWDIQVHLGALDIVYAPLLHQGGTLGFQVHFLSLKILMGTWLICLIVIDCAYQSTLTSAIVIPSLIIPPETFSQLASSDYGVGAIFYESIGVDLRESQDPISHEIAWKVVPHEFISPKCYQMVFESRTACLGYQRIFQFTGAEFLTDIRGRKMGRLSKETRFFTMLAAGISKFYPMFLEPLTNLLGHLSSAGVMVFTAERNLEVTRQKGKSYAKSMVKVKKYYKGDDDGGSAEQDDSRTITVVMEILKGGYAMATLALLVEWFLKLITFFHSIGRETRIAPVDEFCVEDSTIRRIMVKSTVYIGKVGAPTMQRSMRVISD